MVGEPFNTIPSGNDDTMEVSRGELDKEIALAKKNLSSKLDQTKKQEDPLLRLKGLVSQYKQEARENKDLSPQNPSGTLFPHTPTPHPPQTLNPHPLNLRPGNLPLPSSNSVLKPTPPPMSPPPFSPKRKP